MSLTDASRTALCTAFFRGYHAVRDGGRIFDDHKAWEILSDAEREELAESMRNGLRSSDPDFAASFPDPAELLGWIVRRISSVPIVLARARFTEEALEEAIARGVEQYVILGAGMDTFAFRRPDLLQRLQVIEIDHPATQDFKRRRLGELGWEIPANLHFLPVDFTKQSLAERLGASLFDRERPSFVSWLGVTYYLPRLAVESTLAAVAAAAAPGTSIVFDYLDPEAFIPEKAAPRVHFMLKAVARMGEPMLSSYEPLTLAKDLSPLGLSLVEDLSPLELHIRYFRGERDYYACEHFHVAHAVVGRQDSGCGSAAA